jgi:uncharacterized protein YdaU (DUF1376 family)
VADTQAYHKFPYYQYYPADFEQGTATFTLSEVGAYQRLLNYQWTHGSIPGDLKSLAMILRCTPSTAKSVWKTIVCKFNQGEGGQWTNAKMERVRSEAEHLWQRRVSGGKASAAARAQHSPKSPAKSPPAVHQQTTQQSVNYSESESESDRRVDQNKERSDLAPMAPKPHPIREFLSYHEAGFLAKYGHKPAKYTDKDAKHAKDFLSAHGSSAQAIVDAFFASRDPFIAGSGHGLGVLASGTVQNKLIAEMSGRAPVNDGLDGLREFVRG